MESSRGRLDELGMLCRSLFWGNGEFRIKAKVVCFSAN